MTGKCNQNHCLEFRPNEEYVCSLIIHLSSLCFLQSLGPLLQRSIAHDLPWIAIIFFKNFAQWSIFSLQFHLFLKLLNIKKSNLCSHCKQCALDDFYEQPVSMLVNLLTLLRLYGNQIDQRKIDRYISPFLPDSPFLPSLQANPLWESFMWNFFSSVSQGK